MKDSQVTRFQLELSQMESVFTTAPIEHEHLMAPLRYLKEYAKLSKGGDILLIVGPSNSGKSTLLSMFTQHLRATTFACVDEQDLPIIGATAQTSRDSRTTPKYLIESLLSDAGHVLHDPVKRALAGHYPSSRSVSEGRLLQDLRFVFFSRNVRYVVVDEGQFVTRSDNQLFAATLMESLKSLAGPRRNMVICGGYDVVEPALALRAHLSARAIVLHVEPYAPENGPKEWAGILKAMLAGGVLAFPDRAIRNCARELLVECHGCVGLLERRLKDAQAYAISQGLPFDEAALRTRRPTIASWESIKTDLEVGRQVLSRVEWIDSPDGAVLVSASTSSLKPVHQRKAPSAVSRRPRPFETKPARYRGPK